MHRTSKSNQKAQVRPSVQGLFTLVILTPFAYLERWHGSVLWCIQNISKTDADEPFLAGSRCCSCYGRYRGRALGVPIRVQSARRSPVSICIDEEYRHNGTSRAAAGAVHKRDAKHIIVVHLSATFTRATTLRFG
jgi:hypothetical protein